MGEKPMKDSREEIPSLSDIFSDEGFWIFDDADADARVEGEPEQVDYFPSYDSGCFSESEHAELPGVFQEALKLWSQICFVEDTPALKLKWAQAQLYERMLVALSMNSAKASSVPFVDEMPLEQYLDQVNIPSSSSVTSNMQELNFGNNVLNLDDIITSEPVPPSGAPSVTELSADAKTLLEALPDYSYMLSKMLMFPVNR